ncbi:MAG: MBL fold metallo-hydrolase [Anaerolineae bacterium]
MRRDRVAEDIYTFSSDIYAQVTAGIILTSEGTIVIDTLPFPKETREMLTFIKQHSEGPIRYVINTHYHSDHTNGNYLFPEAEIIAHRLCRETLLKWGEQSLAEAKKETPELAEVELRLPNVVFEHDLFIHLGNRTLYLTPLPGHTKDSIGVMIEGDRILFAGDSVLPVPYIVWGDLDATVQSLRAVRALKPESVIQGHGILLLKGELAEEIESSLHYLQAIAEKVQKLVQEGAPESALAGIDIESCGKSRVPLDGLVQYLHQENLIALYARLKEKMERTKKPKNKLPSSL